MKCFVIMPFSKSSEKHTEEFWNSHFTEFIKPMIDDFNLELNVFRSEPLRGNILKQIIQDLIDSHIVVADLTDSNPNVYWELGVRQSFKHGTVTIAEEGTQLPFDINKKGTLFYKTAHTGNKKFIEALKKAIEDCKNNTNKTDSEVLETISGRGTIYEIITREENIRKLEALLEEHSYNEQLLQKTFEMINSNISVNKQIAYGTLRFRYFCIENILINRYISPIIINYSYIGNILISLLACNGQLEIWSHQKDLHIEKWFLAKQPDIEKHMQNSRKEIEKAIESLRNQV